MTDQDQAIEAARHEARRLWQTLQEDPARVRPESAAATAHLAAFGLHTDAPEFLEELRVHMDLLRHGLDHGSAQKNQRGMWWMSLARAHAELAERDDSLADWEEVVRCARASADSSYEDDEMAEYAAFDLVGFHARRTQWFLDAAVDEIVTENQVRDAMAATPEEIGHLSARLVTPVYRVIADSCRAAALGLRWSAAESGDDTDLHESVKLFADTIFQLPQEFLLRVDHLVGFAELSMQLHWRAPERVPYGLAIAAIEEVVQVPGEDEPGLHRLAVHLIEAGHSSDDSEANERAIRHYAACAEEFPDEWDAYGFALYRRAEESDDPDHFLEALPWFERYVERQQPVDKWSYLAPTLLSEGYRRLTQLRPQPQYEDAAIKYATQALALPLPDVETGQILHWQRLAVLIGVHEGPHAVQRVGPLPYLDWLSEAEEAVDLEAVPVTPETAQLATTIGVCWFKTNVTFPQTLGGTPAEARRVQERIEAMLALSKHWPDLDAEFRRHLDMLLEFVRNLQRMTFGDGDADLTHLHRLHAAGQGRLSALHQVLGLFGSIVGSKVKAIGPVRAARKLLEMADDRDEDDRREALAWASLFDMLELVTLNGHGEELIARVERAWQLISALPDSPGTMMLKHMAEAFHRMAALRDGRAPTPARPIDLSSLTGPMTAALALGADISHAKLTRNTARLRELCAELAELAEHPGSTLQEGVNTPRTVLSMALTAWSDIDPADRGVLREAIDVCSSVLDTAPVRHTHDVRSTTHNLAKLVRRRDAPGDRARSRAFGLDLLAHATWTVLQQEDAAHAVEMARNATETADELISWCLEDNAVEDLVRAVDARRALVLKAMGTGRAMTGLLVDAGHHDLARRWAEAEGKDASLVPDSDAAEDRWGGLRREVVRVLDQESPSLIGSPSLPEIREALRHHGSDALVYLLPGNQRYDGTAVIVSAEGEPRAVPLPGLDIGEDSPVGRYQKAYRTWHEAESRNGPELQQWKAELRRVCAWAWNTAGLELRSIADRIVLVPVGPLGMVPWHAAGQDGRHLVQDVTISYTPSARMFCDVVARAEVAEGNPVLVGNPARDLLAGATEAIGIRDSFYPGGLFLGSHTAMPRTWRPAEDGAGTADDVLRLLAKPLPLLHLASHAVADMREPLRSQVNLASGPLAARTLLEISPVDLLQLGLVNLACCTTNVTGVDYDEALSLATTFLAIGARTVIGSLWWVPSGRSTAHLMYMFYRHLNDGLPAAEALRQAQLWMLDPDRVLPEDMPDALRAMLPAAEFSEEQVECWAGFTPLGR
ncbi:CHAT domain-containing protein [Lentzea sp. CA-135723]|uniref:CHAT domain-containing protein n=1 Tax=Lentzea sp. CA-135723 TaxID=3239950 RepID=UPI003D8C5A0D